MNYDQEYYYEKMAQTYAELTGFRPAPASDVSFRFRALAVQLAILSGEIAQARQEAFPSTASGGALDEHAALRGLSRRDACRAQGELRFRRRTAQSICEIPKGFVCACMDGTGYETVEHAVFEPGIEELTVRAQALLPGTAGNALAGTVVLLRGHLGEVGEVSNPQPFSGGADRETDESLRRRLMAAYSQPNNGANGGFYLAHALAFPGVFDAAVDGKQGAVRVLLAGEDARPLPEQTCTELEEQLNRLREPCVTVAVENAEILPVEIEVKVAAETGGQEQIASLLRAELNSRRIGQGCTLARLGQLLMNSGLAENYQFVTPAADLSPGRAQVLRAGEIRIRGMDE